VYLKPLGLFIVSIPKCGSQTLERAIERVSGEKCLPGHIPVGQARKTLGEIEAWALIRDPWERLTSALNYVYGATRTHQISPSEPLFRMIVTNRAISLGSGRRAVLGDEIEVTAHRRKSLLFWRQARDA